MAINRAPFNALIDDNGTGLTGSIWNKAAIQSVLLDPIDAEAGTAAIGSTVTGIQDALTPPQPLNGHTAIFWSGAADLTLNGVVGGAPGKRLTIVNVGTATIWIANNAASAASGTRFGNTLGGPSRLTPVAVGGAAVFVFEQAGFYWRMVSHTQGAWVDVPFNVANFWAGVTAAMVPTNRFTVQGKTLFWMMQMAGAPAPPATPYLSFPLPGGLNMSSVFSPPAFCTENGANTPALLFFGNAAIMQCLKVAGGNWAGTVAVYFTATIALS